MDSLNAVLTLVFAGLVAVATIVIARATNRYVKLNASLVEETRLLRKAQTDPRISVYLRPQELTSVIVDLVVRNDSQAQARNLTFQIEPDIYYFQNQKLSDVDFLQRIPSLQPAESRILPMWTGYWKSIDDSENRIPDTVTIRVTYQDVIGNEKTDNFPLPLRSYSHGENWTGDTALDKIAESLKRLEGTAKKCLEHLQRQQD